MTKKKKNKNQLKLLKLKKKKSGGRGERGIFLADRTEKSRDRV